MRAYLSIPDRSCARGGLVSGEAGVRSREELPGQGVIPRPFRVSERPGHVGPVRQPGPTDGRGNKPRESARADISEANRTTRRPECRTRVMRVSPTSSTPERSYSECAPRAEQPKQHIPLFTTHTPSESIERTGFPSKRAPLHGAPPDIARAMISRPLKRSGLGVWVSEWVLPSKRARRRNPHRRLLP